MESHIAGYYRTLLAYFWGMCYTENRESEEEYHRSVEMGTMMRH